MSLSSLQLDAFLAVVQNQGFSAAAKKLGLTQSALSQRVLNLEDELGTALLLRESSGLRLTEQGERLLRYCQSRESLESDFLTTLKSESFDELRGVVRVAGFSTLNASVLVPVIGSLIQDHPGIHISLSRLETRELPRALSSGRAEFVFLTEPFMKSGIENLKLGVEENVLVRSPLHPLRQDVILDHDEEDRTTHDFFMAQGKKAPNYQRNFVGDIHSILAGVQNGLGRAVVPRHLLDSEKNLEVVSGYKALKTPIYLCFYTQPFYTKLQKSVIEHFQREIPRLLKR